MSDQAIAKGTVQYLGTGRRKTAVARVFLRPGDGKIQINGRTVENYFPSAGQRQKIQQPLLATETAGKFDLLILAHGGGLTGQAEAIRLGVARALQKFNMELRPATPRSTLSCRCWPVLPVRLAMARCAIAAQLAVRWQTAIPRPTTRRR